MSKEVFGNTLAYNLIYVFRINDDHHDGVLKVGMSTVKFIEDVSEIVPNHQYLMDAAKYRIDQYTKTAGIEYELLHTELAINSNNKAFRDQDVHRVLINSGIEKVHLVNGANEWFKTDLETVKNAITAVKEGRHSLSGTEITQQRSPIVLRPNQKEAVEKTIKQFKTKDKMLWNAKMRFGKTLSALQVVKEMDFKKTIIMTHRPVVDDGWFEDFQMVFYNSSNYKYGSKAITHGDSIENLEQEGCNYVYFASIQDLRGSSNVGGKFNKNDIVFSIDWDLVIVDEAHEGTETSLGAEVINQIIKSNSEHTTKLLELSGTPFNLLGKFDEDSIYTWDYVMEQREKLNWYIEHYGDPNPYEDLPKMNIFTYNLDREIGGYNDVEDMAFNFREFFRVWTDNPSVDRRIMPKTAKVGEFVHKEDIKKFLDLLCKEDSKSNYPYSKEEYREYFRHSLWMIPGVKEAKALSKMLHEHPVFGSGAFTIVNVAGEGDDFEEKHYQNAKRMVEEAITAHPEETYTITLSCGKLTTGVSIKAWTAIFMLSGSASVSAQNYLQTIFRAQTPAKIGNRVKDSCYVFDFAPDRTLNMVAQASELSIKPGVVDVSGKVQMGEFLNFCPVIGFNGSNMEVYNVDNMLQQLKRAHADRVVRNGFDDAKLYNENLLRLTELEIQEFNNLANIIGSTKAQSKVEKIDINKQGLTNEEWEKLKEPKKQRELTEEQKAALEKLKEAKKLRKKAIDILRGISIRIPMLIYGADIGIEQDVTIDKFLEIVDDVSWEEFMVKDVTKEKFKQFSKYYDADVFLAAGRKIRNIAKSADKLTPTERVKKIARLFATFKNPDKETVLTPWRVVNMHMSDTLGGWCFYNETFDELNGKLPEPRFVNQGEVTQDTLATQSSKILEINSKSGLYPLYVAYSIYKQRCLNHDYKKLDEAKEKELWKKTLNENVYVVSRTKMAAAITKRSLNGYEAADFNVIAYENIVEDIKEDLDKVVDYIIDPGTWKKEGEKMKFNAVVGNPPYQSGTNGGNMKGRAAKQATPIFNLFVDQAKKLDPRYISMIIPARWYNGGMGLGKFRTDMLSDERLTKLVDFINSKDCFTTVDIGGGLCYFLWDDSNNADCTVVNVFGDRRNEMKRDLNQFGDLFIRSNLAIPIINKIKSKTTAFVSEMVSSIDTFGIPSKVRGQKEKFEGSILLVHSDGANSTMKSYIDKKLVTKNCDLIDKYKVRISQLVPQNGEAGIKPERGYRSISTPHIVYPGEVDSFSYLNIGFFDTESEAENFRRYMMCKFPRFMLRTTYSSSHISQSSFVFVPMMDFTQNWTDEKLYTYFELSSDEIDLIERTMRPIETTE